MTTITRSGGQVTISTRSTSLADLGIAGLATSAITGVLTITKTGSTARTVTFPDASITVARTDAAQTFTGVQTFDVVHANHLDAIGSAGIHIGNQTDQDVAIFGAGGGQGTTLYGQLNGTAVDMTGAAGITTRAAATQDALTIKGRAGGASSYVGTLTPTTLTASRTYTMPDITGTVVLLEGTQTLSGAKTFSAAVSVTNATASTSTTTGALVVSGGVGVAGAGFFGGAVRSTVADATTGLRVAGATGMVRARGYVDATYGAIIDSSNAAESAYNNLTLIGNVANLYGNNATGISVGTTGIVTISNTTASTSTTTGALVCSGGIGVAGALLAGNSILSVSATAGVGYATGAGGTVTQATSRTTGVTINKVCGSITLVSAAGSTSWQTFTVTNSAVAATDTVRVCQKSGTDLNMIHVTAVAAGSFNISFATTGGTTTEQPVFNFTVIKGVTA